MRPAPIAQGAEPAEEIIEFTWNRTGVIRVIVAPGHNINGEFVPLQHAQLMQYTLMWEDYQELAESVDKDEKSKGRPSGAIFIDDFWPFIDKCRQQKDASTLRELAAKIKQQ